MTEVSAFAYNCTSPNSRGTAASNFTFLPLRGWTNPSVFACSARRGKSSRRPYIVSPRTGCLASEMHANLIAPARLQRQFEDRIPFSLRGRPVMRDRFLPLGCTLHAQLAIFGEKRSERPGWWFQSAMHDRDVDPFDVVRGEELL